MVRPIFSLAFGLLLIGTSSATAQFERYELGRRLRVFEVSWDEHNDPQARAKAGQYLKKAVNAFFAAKQTDAARFIAEAQFALRGHAEPTADERLAASLAVKPASRFLDASEPTLTVIVSPFYPVDGANPVDLRLCLTLGNQTVDVALTEASQTVKIPLVGMIPGDGFLIDEVKNGNQRLVVNRQTISIVERRDVRLAAISRTLTSWSKETTIDRASAKTMLGLLTTLSEAQTLESDFPAARLLSELEAQVEAIAANGAYLTRNRPGQAWVTVPIKNERNIATRIFVPERAAKGEPLPLVVALHGAGGSENMFFESYGHGRIVDLCKARGWMLVAPRSGGFGGTPVAEIVDGLATIYPIDKTRVMLIGHSMGAAGAVGAAQVDPGRYAAVAALGGAGSVRPVEALKTLPFFVGVGTEDFALRSSRNLVASLKKAEVKTIEAKEYPTIEHLAIVQVSLDDVFRFFDAHSARTDNK